MSEKTIDPAAAALGALSLVTELIGALGREGVLDMQQIAQIFEAVEKGLPPGKYDGLSEMLSAQKQLAEKFSDNSGEE